MTASTPGRIHLSKGPIMLDVSRFQPSKRRRLSGPGLRTFLKIADQWQLSETQRRLVLGLPSRSTFHGWIAKARKGDELTLSVDKLLRVSLILGIHKDPKIVFARDGDAARWLRSPNSGPVFGGQTPLVVITSGTQDALLLVRRYLDAWRGGTFAASNSGFDDDVGPMSQSDLAFV